MTVRKKLEGTDIFEDVIKQNDRVVQFTIVEIDRDIARNEARIVQIQAEITKLNARKDAAEAL